MIDAVKLWEEIKSNAGERMPLGTCALVHSIVEAINVELQVYTQPVLRVSPGVAQPVPQTSGIAAIKALADYKGSAPDQVVHEWARDVCKRLDEAIHAREHYKELMEWLVEQRRALCQTIGELRRESAELYRENAKFALARASETEALNDCLERSVQAETECHELRKGHEEWARMYGELLEAIAAPSWSDHPKHTAAIEHCKAQRERLDSIENRLSHARDCLSNAEGYISSSANLAAGGIE